MKILITGFDPFGGEKINPAFEAVKRIKDTIEGHHVIKAEIPTVFNKSIHMIETLIAEHNPDCVLCIGQAGGRSQISIERVAINMDDARIGDNEGNQPIDNQIQEEGEAAYFSNLPVKAMVKALQDQGIPSSLSNTAGTYVCNHVMYGVLHLINTKFPHMTGGFIHVPFLPEQVIGKNASSMSLDLIIQGLELAIGTIGKFKEDIHEAYGEIH